MDTRSIGRSRGRSVRPVAEERRPGPSQTSVIVSEPKPNTGGDAGPSVVTTEIKQQQSEVLDIMPQLSLTSKKGICGEPILLSANYFELASKTNWNLNQYHVDFTPDEDRPGVRKTLMRDHQAELGAYIFDGMILYVSNPLKSPTILYSKRPGDEESVKITITFTRQLVQGNVEYLQFFNILMRKCLSILKLQLVGRNYFDPHAKVEIVQYNMELWPGYLTSIRQHEDQILMCTEITHKVMRTDTVLDMLSKMRQINPAEIQFTFKKSVLGLVVLTDYNNRTYRIDDVDFNVSPQSTFLMAKEGEISYKDYYFKRYNLTIKNLEQPLLVSKSKARDVRAGMPETVYLVPELCRMTGLTDDMRSNFQLMSALAQHTRVAPDSRIQKLRAFSKRLRDEKNIVETLQEWNMAVAPDLVTFKGRVLPNERICQGHPENRIRYLTDRNMDWTRNLRTNSMFVVATLHHWVVLVPHQMVASAQNFLRLVRESGEEMGMKMSLPSIHSISDDKQATYSNQLDIVLSDSKPQLVCCVVPNNRSDRYGAIKKKCCVDRAIPSQVITGKAINKKGAISVATKVAIQINCKIGGCPWAIEMPTKGIMVAGFDASHDSMSKGLSFGALVASLNCNFSRYYSSVNTHFSGEELSNAIGLNLIKALTKYKELNNCLPTRIVLYRDGVGDGQISYVKKHEIAMIKEKLSEFYNGAKWRFAFIVVSKRINTRIFSAANSGNAPPGTVVDDCITLPERFDFFIVSQTVRQGTVSPTSYNVIYDNSGLDPDKIQRLTYKMTHLYYNWSGTVRVPAPVQYAHKLAQLVGQNLHRIPHTELETLLYYL